MKKQIKKTVKKGMSDGKKVAIGAGVAAVGVLGGAAYYLLGPNAKAHQKKVLNLHKKGFAIATKMKKEIALEYKKAKVASVPMYHKAVDVVSKNLSRQYKEHQTDINAMAKILKSEFNTVEKVAKKTVKKAVKAATKKRG